MDINKRIFFEWSNNAIIITVIGGSIMVGVLLFLVRSISSSQSFVEYIYRLIPLVLIISAIIYILYWTPVYLKYNETSITIKTIIGRKTFFKEDIINIRGIDKCVLANSTRKIGNGGIGGYTGLFSNSVLGNYYMFVTKKSDLVLLMTKGKRYVFNCSQRNELIEYVRRHYDVFCDKK